MRRARSVFRPRMPRSLALDLVDDLPDGAALAMLGEMTGMDDADLVEAMVLEDDERERRTARTPKPRRRS